MRVRSKKSSTFHQAKPLGYGFKKTLRLNRGLENGLLWLKMAQYRDVIGTDESVTARRELRPQRFTSKKRRTLEVALEFSIQ